MIEGATGDIEGMRLPDLAKQCAELLITHFIILRPSDSRKWEEEPEEWIDEEEADRWEYDLRVCPSLSSAF